MKGIQRCICGIHAGVSRACRDQTLDRPQSIIEAGEPKAAIGNAVRYRDFTTKNLCSAIHSTVDQRRDIVRKLAQNVPHKPLCLHAFNNGAPRSYTRGMIPGVLVLPTRNLRKLLGPDLIPFALAGTQLRLRPATTKRTIKRGLSVLNVALQIFNDWTQNPHSLPVRRRASCNPFEVIDQSLFGLSLFRVRERHSPQLLMKVCSPLFRQQARVFRKGLQLL